MTNSPNGSCERPRCPVCGSEDVVISMNLQVTRLANVPAKAVHRAAVRVTGFSCLACSVAFPDVGKWGCTGEMARKSIKWITDNWETEMSNAIGVKEVVERRTRLMFMRKVVLSQIMNSLDVPCDGGGKALSEAKLDRLARAQPDYIDAVNAYAKAEAEYQELFFGRTVAGADAEGDN